MDIRELLGALWRRRLLAIIVLALELIATVVYLTIAPRVYESTATIAAAPSADALKSEGNLAALQATLARLATTTDVLDAARQRVTPTPALRELRDNVEGALVPGTVLIRVTASDTSPQRAAAIANAVATELPRHDPSAGSFTFSVVDRARPADFPTSPRTRLVLALSIVLGLGLATGAALLRDNAARRVETGDDVQDAISVAVLARLPRPRDESGLATSEPDGRGAAAFRALRIALEFVAAREPLPALVVTSAVPDETEGWLAVNLAVALAQVQHRVLLVDGNLMRPRTHPVLASPDSPGLAEVLAGEPLENKLLAGPVPNLHVLPAGQAPEHIAELVETRFGETMLRWTREFDVVVIDAPAVTTSDDARVMAVAGAVLLAVPSGRVAPRTLRDVAASLRVTNSRLAGTVLVGGEATT